jgi:hypothetical protein
MALDECGELTVDAESEGLRWRSRHVSLDATFDARYEPASDARRWRPLSRERRREPDGGPTLIDAFSDGTLEARREIRVDRDEGHREDGAFVIRLSVRNTSSAPVRLFELVPLRVRGARNLRLDQGPAARWAVLRQGRHKNDLPSVCILGHRDASYRDAQVGVSEDGTKTEGVDERGIGVTSDELTALRGGEGDGPGSLLLGFLGRIDHLVRCDISLEAGSPDLRELQVSCLMDGAILDPGCERWGAWLRVDCREDTFAAIEAYTASRRLGPESTRLSLASRPPSVYCTWYYYMETVTEEDVIDDLEALASKKLPVDVVQIDEGWDWRWGDWQPNARFASGMKSLAERIRSRGFIPGIWTAPFIVEPRAQIVFTHPEWLLRRATGEPIVFEMPYAYVLDVTNPEVARWIEELYRRLTEWGYTYHKVDFARAVAMDASAVFFDRTATRAEAYRRGMEAMRRGMGPDPYLLICGGLFGPSGGIADAQRTGSDVRSRWPQADPADGGPIAPPAFKQNALRFWMGDLWHNDPDAMMVRRRTQMFRGLEISQGTLTDDEARLFALNQYIGGGLVCFSERIGEIDADRLGLLRHVIPSLGTPAIPRDLFRGARYPSVYDVHVASRAEGLRAWHTVAYVNWSSEPRTVALPLDQALVGEWGLGTAPGTRFCVSEFWSGNVWDGFAWRETLPLLEVRPHAAAILRIARQTDEEPMLVLTNGHFSMGGTEVTRWQYQAGRLEVGISWPWEHPLELVFRFAGIHRWRVDGLGAVPIRNEKDLLRIRLASRCEGAIVVEPSSDAGPEMLV